MHHLISPTYHLIITPRLQEPRLPGHRRPINLQRSTGDKLGEMAGIGSDPMAKMHQPSRAIIGAAIKKSRESTNMLGKEVEHELFARDPTSL